MTYLSYSKIIFDKKYKDFKQPKVCNIQTKMLNPNIDTLHIKIVHIKHVYLTNLPLSYSWIIGFSAKS